MTVSITASWSGGKAPLSTFQFMKAATAWSDDVGQKLRSEVKDATPVRSGDLKRGETYDRMLESGSVRISMAAHRPYAPYVIRGTKPHIIRPTAAKALHWVGPGGHVFAKVVHHPGNRANNFPRRVRDAMKQEIVDNLKERLQRELRG